MRRISTVLLLVSGCSFHPPDPGEGPGGDGGSDAPPVEPGCVSWDTLGKHIADPCTHATKNKGWTISGLVTLDTTTGMVTPAGEIPLPEMKRIPQTDGGDLWVVSVENFIVADGGTLRAVGEFPLLILSRSAITIDGTIDVSSKRAPTPDASEYGAGATTTRVGCQTANNGEGTEDAGGGGGGGYGSTGGNGGMGDQEQNPASDRNAGGNGMASTSQAGVIGAGCPGGEGGEDANSRGRAGAGGGAVQLTARTSIAMTTTGRVLAGGMGGEAGRGNGGGGGGGSGGYIGLDAPSIMLTGDAVLAANGGGGGSGCNDDSADPSVNNGRDGLPSGSQASGGEGGRGCPGAAAAGFGDARSSAFPLNGVPTNDSGGGGGGGVGHILSWTPVTFDGASPQIAQPRTP